MNVSTRHVIGGLGLACLLASGCKEPELKPDEVTELLTDHDRGIVVGVDLGDKWDDIKDTHNEKLTLRDETGFEQFRYDLGGDRMRNGFFVSFQLDGAQSVSSISVNVVGARENRAAVTLVETRLAEHFTPTPGSRVCPDGSSGCGWRWIAPSGREIQIETRRQDFEDPAARELQFDFKPAPS